MCYRNQVTRVRVALVRARLLARLDLRFECDKSPRIARVVRSFKGGGRIMSIELAVVQNEWIVTCTTLACMADLRCQRPSGQPEARDVQAELLSALHQDSHQLRFQIDPALCYDPIRCDIPVRVKSSPEGAKICPKASFPSRALCNVNGYLSYMPV